MEDSHELENHEREQRDGQAYMDAYARWDHAGVLACLTDDVEWIVPGAFHLTGKEAFDKEIEGQGNAAPPQISVDRLSKKTTLLSPRDR